MALDAQAVGSDLLSLEVAPWSTAVETDLLKMRDVTYRDMCIYQAQVEAGNFQLLAIQYEFETVGHVIWSVDKEADGAHVIVINAAGARPVRGVDVAAWLIDQFYEVAQSTGARALRAWTIREGLLHKAKAKGAIWRYEMELET